jgi:hypothetical protein
MEKITKQGAYGIIFLNKYYKFEQRKEDKIGRDMWHAWEKRNTYRILKDKPDSKRLFGRPMGRY